MRTSDHDRGCTRRDSRSADLQVGRHHDSGCTRRDSRSADLQVGRLLGIIRALRLCAAQQDRDRHAARRTPRRSVVAARPARLAARRAAAGSLVCDGGHRRRVHHLVRARGHRRARHGIHALGCPAAAARRSSRLVLSRQVALAGRAQLHLPAMVHRRVSCVAVSVFDRSRGDGRCARRSLAAASRLRAVVPDRCGGQARASRGISVLRRHAGPRAGFRERLSVSLFLCRRSLPVSGESRRHRAGCKRPGPCHPRDWACRCSASLGRRFSRCLGC